VNRNRIPSLILSLLIFLLLGGCKDSDQEVIKIDFQVSDFHPVTLYGILANNLFTESHRVTRNQQFADLLQGYKISSRAWQDLNSVSRNLFDFRKVRVGQPYSLFIQPDSVCSLKALVYEMNQTDFVLFHLEDSLRIEN
jgi:hypothetical protein